MMTHDKAMRHLKALTIDGAIQAYIHRLENQSPIVSTSHYYYHACVQCFGAEAWENALDEYFKTLKKEG